MIIHWIVVLVSIIISTLFGEGNPLLLPVPGELLQSNTSAICSEVSIPDIDNFVLCSFIRLNDSMDYSKATLFKLWNFKDTLELFYNGYENFMINYKEKIYTYTKYILFDKWFKICITVTNASEIKFEINYRLTRISSIESNNEEKSEEEKEKIKETMKQMTIVDDFPEPHSPRELNDVADIVVGVVPIVHLCAGSYESSKVSSIAAFALTTLTANSEQKSNLTNEKDSCVFESFNDSLTAFPGTTQVTYGDVKDESFSLTDICWDIQGFIMFNDSSYYDEHVSRCHSLNGRLIKQEEFEIFFEKLKDILMNETYSKNETIKSGDEFVWLEGGTEGANSLSVICPVYNVMENESRHIPCIFELTFNFCMVPMYSAYYYFGSLIKYDWYYTFHVLNNSIIFEGDEGTQIKKKGDDWVLSSVLHKEYATLSNATIPIGRNMWKHFDQKEFNLTITSCNDNHFTCSNGHCLSLEARCNGTVECLDASDEENCVLINKKSGYLINRAPPPRNNESIFSIKYTVQIFNIADISTSDGIAVVDAAIDMTWFDPRITFKNPVIDEEINCKDIWTPLMSMADGAESGFQIFFNPYRSNCYILSSKYEKDNAVTKEKSEWDPYMGQYVEGKDLPISYMFAGLITVPCRFDLRKYPFGIQKFNITFWPDNAYMTSANYKMEFHCIADLNDSKSNELYYRGKTDLGEFNFLSAIHKVDVNGKFVTITFKLQNLFGYHLLNSFTPSILISLIAYSTLFFPITDFNERVMVSLTALLVLAALFTQSSNTSVKTPYFKYLDIWYVVLIIFCFLVVTANMIIHKISKMKIVGQDTFELRALKSEEKEEELESYLGVNMNAKAWLKKVKNINKLLEIFFFSFLSIFILTYTIGASI